MRRRSCGGRERRAVSDSGSSGRPKPHVGGQCGSEAAKMAVWTSGDSHEDTRAARLRNSRWGKWGMAKMPSIARMCWQRSGQHIRAMRPRSGGAALRALQAIRAGKWQSNPRTGRLARLTTCEAEEADGRPSQRRAKSGLSGERPRGAHPTARSISEE